MVANVILDKIEFEREVGSMKDRQLIEFIARQVFLMCTRCDKEDIRISALEGQNKKLFGLSGGIGGIIGAAVVAMVDYFVRRSW